MNGVLSNLRMTINPLMTFCETPEKLTASEISLRRSKRLAFITLGIIALISVVVSTTIGISTSSVVAANKANARLDVLEQQQKEMLNRLELMRTNEKKMKEIMTKLQKEIRTMGTVLQSVTESLNLLNHVLPRTMYYISNIAARFLLVKDRLIDVSRKWRVNKVDEKILDIFNFTLPCEPYCSLDSADPLSCKVDILRNTVSLVFDLKSIKLMFL